VRLIFIKLRTNILTDYDISISLYYDIIISVLQTIKVDKLDGFGSINL